MKAEIEMNVAWIEWAERQIKEYQDRLPLLEDGRVTVGQMVDGVRTDTTPQAIDDMRRWIVELQELVAAEK